MEALDDSPLLPLLARGDPTTFSALVDRYAGLVWSLVRRRGTDPAEAEDAVQEIFTELWRNAERFDPGRAREVTFVAMIARRRLIDRHRKATRERRGLEDLAREARATAPVDPGLDAVPDAGRAGEAIHALEGAQREVLGLSLLQGLTHREIADATSLPLGTVKSHLRRGLERVRSALAGERR